MSKRSRRFGTSFTDKQWEQLDSLFHGGRFSTVSAALKTSLDIARSIQLLQAEGFRNFVAENPDSGERVVLEIPTLAADNPLARADPLEL